MGWFPAAILPAHWLLISSYEDWAGGHSYGRRCFSDLRPIFVYFLIPVVAPFARAGAWRRSLLLPLCVAAAAWS